MSKQGRKRRHWSDLSGAERFMRKAWERVAYDWNPIYRIIQARRYRRLLENVKVRARDPKSQS